ncbi:MAG: putative sulfate/molybdate transporter [Bacteroidales bacterium]
MAIPAFGLGLVFIGNRKYPPALFILSLGIIYAFLFQPSIHKDIHLHLPVLEWPAITPEHIWTGFLLLALPQIPLSLGNSIFAKHQLIKDYFPEKQIRIKKIGLTYSLMNIFAALTGGIPVCHGSGGVAGIYTFGGRTGGSTFIYGLFYILLGLFMGMSPSHIFGIFPKPILGVILLFEGIALILLVKDIITNRRNFFLAILVGLMANGILYGYLTGMIVGALLFYLPQNWILKDFSRTH